MTRAPDEPPPAASPVASFPSGARPSPRRQPRWRRWSPLTLVVLAGCATDPGRGVTVLERQSPPAPPFASAPRVGLISTNPLPLLRIQWPRTRQQALAEVEEDATHFLGGFMAYAGFLWPAAFATTPYLSARAAAAGLSGLSSEEFHRLWEAHSDRLSQVVVHDALRQTVAAEARARGWTNLFLVSKPWPAERPEQFARMAFFLAATLAWLPPGTNPVDYLRAQGADAVLELEVTGAALAGKPGSNPPLTLSYRLEARLRPAPTRPPVARLRLAYRSKPRKFDHWMERDAQLLREELQSSYLECADLILDWYQATLAASRQPPGLNGSLMDRWLRSPHDSVRARPVPLLELALLGTPDHLDRPRAKPGPALECRASQARPPLRQRPRRPLEPRRAPGCSRRPRVVAP